MKSNGGLIALATIFVLLMLVSPTYAWQLGGQTTNSGNATAIRASRLIHGTLPSDQWYTSVSGFTDTNNWWHTIGQDNDGHLGGEYIPPGGGSQGWTFCTKGKDAYHDGEITWTAGNWLYDWPSETGCSWGLLSESGTPKVQGTSVDMFESNDNTASDFANMKVYVYFSPSLRYYNGGWQYSTYAYSYTGFSPPNSIGQHFYCGPLSTQTGSNWAPPKSTGSYSINC